MCDKIIKYFEEEENKYTGITFKGLDKKVKDTTDYIIPLSNDESCKWYEINNKLNNELDKNLKIYINTLDNKENFKSKNNYDYESDYMHLSTEVILINNFMIQRYNKSIGKYVYHDDFSVDINKNSYRVITYLWYLNDVEEGGETEFFGGEFKMKPEAGKILFFPSFWSFPHRGNMPKSSNKYIITGWLHKPIPKKRILHTLALPEKKILKLESNPLDKDQEDDNQTIDIEKKNNQNIQDSEKELQFIIYNHFKSLFYYFFTNYENLLLNKESILNANVIIKNSYSKLICEWIMNESLKDDLFYAWIDEESTNKIFNYMEIKNCLSFFILSTFQVISSKIRDLYNLYDLTIVFNITSSYIIECNNTIMSDCFNNDDSLLAITILLNENNDNIWSYKSNNEEIILEQGDLMIQTIDNFKKNIVNSNVKYILIFFVDFTLKYQNKDEILQSLPLKNLIEKIIIPSSIS
jgi:hypothetical protein